MAKGKLLLTLHQWTIRSQRVVGFDADLAKAFAKSLGVECEFIEINWDSKTMELDSKNVDCIWNEMTLTDGVMKTMDTSNAYCNNSQIIVAKPTRALDSEMEGGKIVEQGTSEQIFDNPKSKRLKDFLNKVL